MLFVRKAAYIIIVDFSYCHILFLFSSVFICIFSSCFLACLSLSFLLDPKHCILCDCVVLGFAVASHELCLVLIRRNLVIIKKNVKHSALGLLYLLCAPSSSSVQHSSLHIVA